MWRSLIQRLSLGLSNATGITCRGLAKYPFRVHGKTPNGIIRGEKELILLGDLNCDLLLETISKSKHLVHIYNTYGFTQVIMEATRTI